MSPVRIVPMVKGADGQSQPHFGRDFGGVERRSRFQSAAEWKDLRVPPREWLVEGLVPYKTVTLFSGDGGTGKSLLSLQLAAAVASGGTFLGMPVRQGGVIVLSAEDDLDELHRRTNDIVRSTGQSYDDIAPLIVRSLAGEDALLALDRQLKLTTSSLFDEVEALAADEKPALIVIDTLADVYPANENDRTKVRQFVGLLRRLAVQQGCAVLLLSHPSLQGLNSGSGTSGSTAWNNSVRSRLYLERITDSGREPDPNRRVLRTMKANYGRIGDEITLVWKNGVFEREAAAAKAASNAEAEKLFLEIFDKITGRGLQVSPNPSSTYAPTVFAKDPLAKGTTKKAFAAAMMSLLDRGIIVVETHGRGNKVRRHLAKKDPQDAG